MYSLIIVINSQQISRSAIIIIGSKNLISNMADMKVISNPLKNFMNEC